MWGFLFTKVNLCKEGIYFQLRANLCNQLHFEHNKCNEWLQCYSTGAVSPQTPQLPPLVETVLGWRRGSKHGLWVAWELPSAWPQRWIHVFWRVPPFSVHKSLPVPPVIPVRFCWGLQLFWSSVLDHWSKGCGWFVTLPWAAGTAVGGRWP